MGTKDKKNIFEDGFSMNSQDEVLDKNTASINKETKENEENTNKDFLANINKQAAESFQEETFILQKTNNKKWIIPFVIISIVILAGYMFLNRKVEVIDFTHMTYEDVVAWASDKDVIITVSNDYSNEIDIDHVISQNILPGEKVKKETNINVVLSKGLDPYQLITIPEFDSSWSRTRIEQWLEQNGIENFTFINIENEEIETNYLISYRLVGATNEDFMRNSEIEFTINNSDEIETVTVNEFLNRSLADVDVWSKNNDINYTYSYQYSTIYDRDKIMYQSIPSGEEMNINETLAIIISKGEPEVIVVGNFLNSTLIEAEIWAKNNGIKYTCAYEYSSIYDKGRIMSQSIISGEEINENDTIHFIISKGEAITVPSFSNLSVAEAQGYQEEGLVIDIIETYKDGTKAGDFISQSIAAGTKVEENTRITVNYSLGDKITVPNYINQLKINFEQWVKEQNLKDANITLTVKEDYNPNIEYGKIISQNIYNEDVDLTSNITILVSLGEAYEVIDFSSMTRNEIQSYCDGEGLTVVFEEVADSGLESGSFINQYPLSGETISKKDFITIQVAK